MHAADWNLRIHFNIIELSKSVQEKDRCIAVRISYYEGTVLDKKKIYKIENEPDVTLKRTGATKQKYSKIPILRPPLGLSKSGL